MTMTLASILEDELPVSPVEIPVLRVIRKEARSGQMEMHRISIYGNRIHYVSPHA